MPANLSLILNLMLLVFVVVAIGRLMKSKREAVMPSQYQPSLGMVDERSVDDIISVRKVSPGSVEEQQPVDSFYDNPREEQDVAEFSTQGGSSEEAEERTQQSHQVDERNAKTATAKVSDQTLMVFLLAKNNRHFAGYELLQTLLASGLRFGEGYLFHRHQQANGQGPVIFSLAAATQSGVFDLQNIGAFSARGLCLFMQLSGNAAIDVERFDTLYETAKQLSEGLDAHILDEQRRPLTKEGLLRYHQRLSDAVGCE